MPKTWDAVVVGANVAGSSISRNLAKKGLKVAFLDLLAGDKIGSDSCGDGLDVHEFKRLGIEIPKGDFVYGDVIRGKVIAPNGKAELAAQGKIKAVHRYYFVQDLKERAEDSGAELIAPARAIAPIIKNNYVIGLKYRPIRSSLKTNDTKTIYCSVLIDASGINACIRNQLPSEWWITEKIEKKDIAVCYKESRYFNKPLKNRFIHGYFTSKVAPGGFYWLATRSLKLINVGLGINYNFMPLSPKYQLYNKIITKHTFLDKSKVIWHGGGLVPRRRPLDCMVGNGVVAAGDAAVMVNPMSGGGIGPSIFAGKLAGEVIASAIESGKCSINKLWQYNFLYQTNYGPVQAGNYILRKTIEDLTDAQLDALLGAKLFTEKEIIEVIESGKLEIGFISKIKKLGKLAKHPKLLLKLRGLYKNMEKARSLYDDYPNNPADFLSWQKKVHRFFKRN